jgi:hypothetical protein
MLQRCIARAAGAPAKLARGLAGTPYGAMSVGVPKETAFLEARVSQTPETVGLLVKEGFKVKVEKGAGVAASFPDAAYAAAGAELVDRDGAFAASIVTKVAIPTEEELKAVGCARTTRINRRARASGRARASHTRAAASRHEPRLRAPRLSIGGAA